MTTSKEMQGKRKVLATVSKVLNLQYSRHNPNVILVQDMLGVKLFDTKAVSYRQKDCDVETSL